MTRLRAEGEITVGQKKIHFLGRKKKVFLRGPGNEGGNYSSSIGFPETILFQFSPFKAAWKQGKNHIFPTLKMSLGIYGFGKLFQGNLGGD